MSILNSLFGRRSQQEPLPDPDIAREIAGIAGCEWVTVDPELDAEGVTALYLDALHEGRMVGFHPLLVLADAVLLEMLQINCEDNAGLEAYRGRLLLEDAEGGKQFLRERFADVMPDQTDTGLYGAFDEDAVPPSTFASVGRKERRPDQTLIMLKLPIAEPWRCFAYLPIGNWNDCPAAQQIMAASKYWQKRFGALPAVISRDELQYYVPVPVTLRTMAMELAEEHYGFCPDIVDQGTGTVGNLAGNLADSNIWYFWWD